MDTPQIKYSFDEETIKKVLKGAMIAGTSAAALFILSVIGTLEIDNILLASFIAWFVPTMTNTVKEWAKGI